MYVHCRKRVVTPVKLQRSQKCVGAYRDKSLQNSVIRFHNCRVHYIRRLLGERPDAIGLAVPGMPYGSPGMGPEAERDAYDVVLVEKDGSGKVFTSYPAG